MELRAVFEALTATPRTTPLTIETDSQYVIGVFTEWLDTWKRNGWRTAGRKPVANRAAIEEVDGLLAGRDVQWRHVKGHSGHLLNEVVDKHARDAAIATRDRRRVETGTVSACSGAILGRAQA
jgi:ribonuclease HI